MMLATKGQSDGNHEDKRQSIKLSWLLRHGAMESNLRMDGAGFARVEDVLRLLRLSRAQLQGMVENNNKARYELSADGQHIRARQGHSAGTPVTLDGLEASWSTYDGDADVYHGTNVVAARSILTGGGIHAASRSHVHLAPAIDSVVGKRAQVDVLLVVRPSQLRAAGVRLFVAPNGVVLARAVPTAAIVDVRAVSREGNRALADLRTLLAAARVSDDRARR